MNKFFENKARQGYQKWIAKNEYRKRNLPKWGALTNEERSTLAGIVESVYRYRDFDILEVKAFDMALDLKIEDTDLSMDEKKDLIKVFTNHPREYSEHFLSFLPIYILCGMITCLIGVATVQLEPTPESCEHVTAK